MLFNGKNVNYNVEFKIGLPDESYIKILFKFPPDKISEYNRVEYEFILDYDIKNYRVAVELTTNRSYDIYPTYISEFKIYYLLVLL